MKEFQESRQLGKNFGSLRISNINALWVHLQIKREKTLTFNILFFQRGKKFLYTFWFLLCDLNGPCDRMGLNEMNLLSDTSLDVMDYKAMQFKRHPCKPDLKIMFKRSYILILIDKLAITWNR